eukprot:COSAG04_NODE_24562_length_320_cov_0.692308_1_plen_28_part_01
MATDASELLRELARGAEEIRASSAGNS